MKKTKEELVCRTQESDWGMLRVRPGGSMKNRQLDLKVGDLGCRGEICDGDVNKGDSSV